MTSPWRKCRRAQGHKGNCSLRLTETSQRMTKWLLHMVSQRPLTQSKAYSLAQTIGKLTTKTMTTRHMTSTMTSISMVRMATTKYPGAVMMIRHDRGLLLEGTNTQQQRFQGMRLLAVTMCTHWPASSNICSDSLRSGFPRGPM